MEAERPKHVCNRCAGRFCFAGFLTLTYVTRGFINIYSKGQRWIILNLNHWQKSDQVSRL
jgi:hypothetical protein